MFTDNIGLGGDNTTCRYSPERCMFVSRDDIVAISVPGCVMGIIETSDLPDFIR